MHVSFYLCISSRLLLKVMTIPTWPAIIASEKQSKDLDKYELFRNKIL